MMRRLIGLVALMIICISAIGLPSTPQVVHSQTEDDSPPQIIDLWPAVGVEIGRGDTLTITFDQPMDQQSVVEAVKIVPQVSGSFGWDDAQTLTFTPTNGWPLATTLQLTIRKTARGANKLPLENDATYTLKTAGGLKVASLNPPDKSATVLGDDKIVVSFDRPVVPLTTTEDTEKLPSPITIKPAIVGKGRWVNTALYVFTPTSPLPGGTTYTITVAKGLVASDGSSLPEDVTSTFTITPPIVTTIEVTSAAQACQTTQVGLDCPITVRFSEAMDRASTEAAFKLIDDQKQQVAGSLTWTIDDKAFVFQPSARLHPATTYQVTVEQSAQNKAHSPLAHAESSTFTTIALPAVAQVSPPNGGTVEPGFDFSIYFVSLMKFSTIKSRLTISPMPPDLQINTDFYSSSAYLTDNTTAVYLSFKHQPQTTYTITLKAGAQDVYGNAIDKDQSFTFTTTLPKSVPAAAYPVLNGTFMTTDDYQGHPHISVLVRGKSSVNFTLYAMTTEPFGDALSNYQFGDYCQGSHTDEFLLNPEFYGSTKTLWREWEQTFDEDEHNFVRRDVDLAGSGQILPPGLYMVIMNSTSGFYTFIVAASTANITLKRTQDQLFVWVTDIATARPLADVPVTLYSNPYVYDPDRVVTTLAIGKTDGNGVIRADISKLPRSPMAGDYFPEIYVVAQREGVYGAWYSCLSYYYHLPTRQAYLYTDRPIYRPGETVYVKGIVRARQDMTFTPLPKKTAHIAAYERSSSYSYNEKPFFETDVPITERGSFSTEFKLSDTAALGNAKIELTFPDDTEADHDSYESPYGYFYSYTPKVEFTISAFRPPEFAVSIDPAESEIIQGDPLHFQVGATYYSGGGVNDAAIQWATYSAPADFQYKGKGNYVFDDERWPYFYNGKQDAGAATTDDKGTQKITSTTTLLSDHLETVDEGSGGRDYSYLPSDPPPSKRPVIYIGEATVVDQAAQPVSARTKGTFAHPANVYLGIDAQSWGAPSGKPTPIRLIAVRPDSTPIAGQSISLTITRFTWKLQLGSRDDSSNPSWIQMFIEITTTEVKTGSDGTVTFEFTPPISGLYRVAVQTTDEKKRVNSATLRLYVTGQAETLWNDPLAEMEPIADKQSYKPGETATINVPTSFAGRSTVLVTVERAGVITSEVVSADGPTLNYKLPILDSYAPGAFVDFTVYRGVDVTHLNPDYRHGQVKIDVEPVARRLKVTLTPSSSSTTPRGTVTFGVLVTDAQGKPVSAEVGLALVDKSVLALIKPHVGTLEEDFYNPDVNNYTHTNLSMYGYMPLLTDSYIVPCCFGGGAGGPFQLGDFSNYIRSNFKFTALWSPFVVTDKDGKATVTVTLPDNATTWVLDARAVTTDTEVGQGTTEVIATLPLLMRPVTPRFFVAGDKVQLAAVINNNTGQDQMVKVSLKVTGVILADPETQTVTIPSGQRARVTWMADVSDEATNADLVFSVVGQNGFSDAARPLIATGPNGTIPIYRYVAYDNVATAGSLLKPGSRTDQIYLASRLYGGQGALTIRFDPSLAAAMTDSLDYLRSYPFDCVEQTVSKLLPNIYTLRALKKLNINDPQLAKKLDESIHEQLSKLNSWRNGDGGWGWWSGRQSDPLVTAYVIFALTEAEDAGYSGFLDDSSIEPISRAMDALSQGTDAWAYNRRAFFVYVEARFLQTRRTVSDLQKDIFAEALKALFEHRAQLNYSAQAYLLLAFHMSIPGAPEITQLAADLESEAITTATSAHWEESDTDWWNWGSNVRSTAVILDALIVAKPDNPLLPAIVRWLMNARRDDHWKSTQETVWSIIALTDWMVQTGELRGNFEYQVTLNGNAVFGATVTPLNVRESQSLQIDLKKLLLDQANSFVIQKGPGDGALYYTANLKVFEPAETAKALSRGVSITRQYFPTDKSAVPITSARLGDVITVRLTLTVSQDMRYFVLEDPIPAGTEGIDTSLLTTSLSVKGPDLTKSGDDYYWSWGWWYIDRTELRDQQVNLYATYLPRGTYTFTYQLRATVPGQFQTMPAHAYPFYYPDVFGRSSGQLFTIQE